LNDELLFDESQLTEKEQRCRQFNFERYGR
jgi:hypothetical protein